MYRLYEIGMFSLIQFLTRDITKRLGVKEMDGLDGIKRHPFFKSINWVELEAKNSQPPFVPDVLNF